VGGDVGGDERGQRSVRALQSAIRFASGCLLYADRRARGSLCASGVVRARDARRSRATRRGREGRARRALDAPSSPRNPPSTSRSGAGASRSPRRPRPRWRRSASAPWFPRATRGITELGGRDAARLTARRRVRSARLTARLTARASRRRDLALETRAGVGSARAVGSFDSFFARAGNDPREREDGRFADVAAAVDARRASAFDATATPLRRVNARLRARDAASAAFALARACDVRACGGGW